MYVEYKLMQRIDAFKTKYWTMSCEAVNLTLMLNKLGLEPQGTDT